MSMIVRTTENTAVNFPIWLFILASPFILAFYLIVGTLWLLIKLATLLIWLFRR